jgi:putative endonuclease
MGNDAYMWVYIMASRRNGTLYIGVTGDLHKRVTDHRDGRGSEFTRKYNVTRLVHVEWYSSTREAIQREKRLRNWKRAWKITLIEQGNPTWSDLWYDLPFDP